MKTLIIGAGPVGLGCAKALAEAAVDYVQVEATDHVGGNWAHGVYTTAHIISSRKTTEYADHPMPRHWPAFPSAKQMCTYYNDYADTYELRQRIRFETRVTAMRPLERGWEVDFEAADTERFAAVVICNGHHWKRVYPEWAADFSGEVLHSKDYKRPEQLAGKRVLVVGGGNSGCDIAAEAARVASSTDWSLRQGVHFLPKTLFGVPTVELMRPWMPVGVQRAMLKLLTRITVGPYEGYGLPTPSHRLFEEHPTINTEIFRYLDHGKISVRPGVSSVDGDTVHFVDGASKAYDLVACGTGYAVSLPMLPEGMLEVRGKVAQLIGGMLIPGQRDVYVVGTTQPRYGLGPLVTPAAQLLARWIRLQEDLDLPLVEVLQAMGQKPPHTHLVDPHQALRQIRLARRTEPLIRRQANQMLARRSSRSSQSLGRDLFEGHRPRTTGGSPLEFQPRPPA